MNLESTTWKRTKEVLAEALELPPNQREAFVASACGGDPKLIAEVHSLLSAHDRAEAKDAFSGAFLETESEAPDPRLGTHLGPYRLEARLGHGGMGAVYRAVRDDGQFEQHVAIKIVRMDSSREDLKRFRAERRILAGLEHPNIAHMIGGDVTDDGLPYLVMELVEGEHLNVYCDRLNLSTSKRLELFRTVCAAVQKAHQNLVVHRDLKPSNILVTSDGTVKLLDFGIAKLTESDDSSQTRLTRTGFRAMTPEYASPEQIRGDTISTSSDVYTLGVLLYELLTGERPYQLGGLSASQIERVVCQDAPPRPSSGAKHLSGDLDTIILTAMHKDPARRYSSVETFSEDIRRFLEGLPVVARGDSAAYRLSKFMARNRLGVAILSLFLIGTAISLVAISRQARIAEQRLTDGRQLANTLLLEIHDSLLDLPGSTPARRALVTSALGYLDGMIEEAGADPKFQTDLATAYETLGDLQGNPLGENIGDLKGAMASYQKAIAIRRDLLGNDPTDPGLIRDLAIAEGRSAMLINTSGDGHLAIKTAEKSLEQLDQINTPPLDDAFIHRTETIRSHYAWFLMWEGKVSESKTELAKAIPRLEAVAQRNQDDLGIRLDHWRSIKYSGDSYIFDWDPVLCVERFEEGMTIIRELETEFPDNPRVQRAKGTNLKRLGDCAKWTDRPQDCLDYYRESLAIAEDLARSDPENATAQRGLAYGLDALGAWQASLGDYEEGLPLILRALDIRERIHASDAVNATDANVLAITHMRLGEAYIAKEDFDQARVHAEKSIGLREDALGDDVNPLFLGNLASVYGLIARIERARGKTALLTPAQAKESWLDSVHHYDQCLTILAEVDSLGGGDFFESDVVKYRAEREEVIGLLGP